MVHVFVAGQPAVDGLAKQIDQRKLCVLTAARIGQVVLDEFSEPESFVQFADHTPQCATPQARSSKPGLPAKRRAVPPYMYIPPLTLITAPVM